jgi:sugar phosphate isomerase/epimerase
MPALVDFPPTDADRVREMLGGHGLTIAAPTYCENTLHPDEHERRRIQHHLPTRNRIICKK